MFQEPDDTRPLVPFGAEVKPPDADPASGDLIRIEVNRAWLPFVVGSCLRLLDDQIWDVATDEERELADIRANDLIVQLTVGVVEPPFYDDDETADDRVLPEAPWYEKLSDWIISVFLATTFTPGAAIVYQATIPKMRLAFRTGNLGAIVRVLLDNLEIWTGNTNAAEVGLLEANLDLADFALENNLGAPPWELKIIHGGAPLGMARLGETSSYALEVELGDIRPREATLQIRQNGCVIETSTNGIDWTALYDPTNCINGLVEQGIQDAIEDGTIGPPQPQPGPEPAPEPGFCKTYHAILPANGVWLLPMPVQAGDTIEITKSDGAWHDHSLMGFGLWQCVDGRAFGAGECGIPDNADPEDPLQTAWHMQLVARIGETYLNPFEKYTVAPGVVDEPVYFLANDSDLSDNQGTVTFDVEVCRGVTSGWCFRFDFTSSDPLPDGWTIVEGTRTEDGLENAQAYNGQYLMRSWFKIELTGHEITEIHMEYEVDNVATQGAGLENTLMAGLFYNPWTTIPGTVIGYNLQTGPGNVGAIEMTGLFTEWNCLLCTSSYSYATYPGVGRIKSITLKGTTNNPFGETNCT